MSVTTAVVVAQCHIVGPQEDGVEVVSAHKAAERSSLLHFQGCKDNEEFSGARENHMRI